MAVQVQEDTNMGRGGVRWSGGGAKAVRRWRVFWRCDYIRTAECTNLKCGMNFDKCLHEVFLKAEFCLPADPK